MKYPGRCHCGAVTFEVELDDRITALECNCSICDMVGFLHAIAPRDRFRLLGGEDAITTYTFGTKVARHTFCKHCGVKPFYTPRSHPDSVSVNLRCLERRPPQVDVEPFDGQNWEDNVASVQHLGRQ